MEMILSLPSNIFVLQAIQMLGGFLARFPNTNNQPRLSQKPKHLSPLQQESLSVHYKPNHLPFTIMLRLSNMSILPCRFLKLRNYLPPCVSCVFGQAHRRLWRHKSSTTSTGRVLRSADITNPGQQVGTYQIVSAQPGLVPQEKFQMTRALIWGSTVLVDYASR